MYTKQGEGTGLTLEEQHLYGSARLGIRKPGLDVADPLLPATEADLLGNTWNTTFERGKKFFELSNHLGNVLVTVSDRKILVKTGSGNETNGGCDQGTAIEELTLDARGSSAVIVAQQSVMLLPGFSSSYGDNYLVIADNNRLDCENAENETEEPDQYYFIADVMSASDYYPFGMLMPDRNYSGAEYRYGFNGKENDNDVKGEGNQQDYGMRIYDPRLGKFLSVDPLTKGYASLTPYQFASNSPIANIDVDGAESQNANKNEDSEVKKLHPHIEELPAPTASTSLPARNTGSRAGTPELYSTSSMLIGRHNDDETSDFNSAFSIIQVDVIKTGKYLDVDGKTYWQESKSVVSTEMTMAANFNGKPLSTSQMTQTAVTTYSIETKPISLEKVKGEVVSVDANIVFLNAHGNLGSGVGQVEANEDMMKLKEMGRTYTVNHDGRLPLGHIKDAKTNLFAGFFKTYSTVLQKAIPGAGKLYKKIAEQALKNDFGKTVFGTTGVFSSRIVNNGVVIRDQKMKNINE